MQDKDGEQVENMIYSVLRQRHMKEAIHQEEHLERETAAMTAEARAVTEDRRALERDKLNSAFEQELLDLMTNAGGLSSSEMMERKEELKKEQQVHMTFRACVRGHLMYFCPRL